MSYKDIRIDSCIEWLPIFDLHITPKLLKTHEQKVYLQHVIDMPCKK